MKVKTKWDREVWCRDSVWESSTDEQEILIWGSEQEYALGSNVNEYITKGDLEFIEWDADYTPAADDNDILYDTGDVTLPESDKESIALVETPVISTEDRKESFLVGDVVNATVLGEVVDVNYAGNVLVKVNEDVTIWVPKENVKKAVVLTPGAVYRINNLKYILTTNNLFVGIEFESLNTAYTLEQAQQLNITKE